MCTRAFRSRASQSRRVLPLGRDRGAGARGRHRSGGPVARTDVRQHRRPESGNRRQQDRGGQRHHKRRSLLGLPGWGRGELWRSDGVPVLDLPGRAGGAVRLELALGGGRPGVAGLARMVVFTAGRNVVELLTIGCAGSSFSGPFRRWASGWALWPTPPPRSPP